MPAVRRLMPEALVRMVEATPPVRKPVMARARKGVRMACSVD